MTPQAGRQRRFDTLRECRHCHEFKHFYGTRYCDPCKPLVKRIQTKLWVELHPEAVREAEKRRLARNPDHYRDRNRRWREQGKRRTRVYRPVDQLIKKQRREAHLERLAAARRDTTGGGTLTCSSCQSRLPCGWFPVRGRYADGAPRRYSWCLDCIQSHKAVSNRKRADAGVPRWVDRRQIARLLRLQNRLCKACGTFLMRRIDGRTGYHLDHDIPVIRGGKHVEGNLQLLCVPCNLSKGGKTMAEFMAWRKRR